MIYLREEINQFSPAFLQPHNPTFWGVDLLADFRAERRPAVLRNQIGLGIGIAPAVRHPDIAGAQRAPQFPEGAELVIVPVNAAIRSHDIGAPLPGDEVRRSL